MNIPLISVKDYAKRYGINIRTLRWRLFHGKLPYFKHSPQKRWLIPPNFEVREKYHDSQINTDNEHSRRLRMAKIDTNAIIQKRIEEFMSRMPQ